MKIIVEANIPYMRGLLEPFGTVDYLPADAITADAVKPPTPYSCAPEPIATVRSSTEATWNS